MPELPDVEDYVAALRSRLVGSRIERLRITGVSLLRTVDPPVDEIAGRLVQRVHRLGKRIVIGLEDDLHVVVHLMIAGRLRWRDHGAKVPARIGLAALDVVDTGGVGVGTLLITEAGTTRRASLHLVRGTGELARHDRGGVEPLEADLAAFTEALRVENRTLKRVLTDPRRFSGIGNAYSDEILHTARLSPVQHTRRLTDEQVRALRDATREVLATWVAHCREETGEGFPEHVTAFREGFAAHGRYGRPCPRCGTDIQRIRYASNETNYCPTCQTGGRVLADRSLSRLLRDDWPRTVDQLEGA